MKLVFLDIETLENDALLDEANQCGELVTYLNTKKEETLERVKDADVVVTNKVVIDKYIIDNSSIKLIYITGKNMNNIDYEYARSKQILVKNSELSKNIKKISKTNTSNSIFDFKSYLCSLDIRNFGLRWDI